MLVNVTATGTAFSLAIFTNSFSLAPSGHIMSGLLSLQIFNASRILAASSLYKAIFKPQFDITDRTASINLSLSFEEFLIHTRSAFIVWPTLSKLKLLILEAASLISSRSRVSSIRKPMPVG